MLGNLEQVAHIYIVCGYTDMRKSIDGLASIVKNTYELDPFSDSLFLFCGRRGDRLKALHWEQDGFLLLYKRLDGGKFQWPRKPEYKCQYKNGSSALVRFRMEFPLP